MSLQIGQFWWALSFNLCLVRGHVVNNRFTIHVGIVSEENRAGLHLELAIHFGEACYFYDSCASGWDANGSGQCKCLSFKVLLSF